MDAVGVFASPATGNGLAVPRGVRGYGQALPRRVGGGLTPLLGRGPEHTLEMPVPAWSLLHCQLWLLESSLWVLSARCGAGVVNLSSSGVPIGLVWERKVRVPVAAEP